MPAKFYPDALGLPELYAKIWFLANTYYAVMHMHDSVQQITNTQCVYDGEGMKGKERKIVVV